MPFPAGMVTRTVSFAPFYDLEGKPVRVTLRVMASRALVWTATNETILRDAEVPLYDTPVVLTLPTTDQTGVGDGAGNTVVDWTYTASYQLAKGGQIPDTTFLLPLDTGLTYPVPRDVTGLAVGSVVNTPVPVEGPAGPPGPGGTWGSITGTLSSQTDLQAALDGKQAAGSYAAAVHTHVEADVTGLVTDLAAKAPLASPALTGNPTAPTPATADNDTSIATTAFVKAQAYAPLASPSFTGTPTVPTAAGGTNTTQAASTAFVAAAIAALVNASPATLDTLNELATALGNDPNFATTMTNALAGKLNVSLINAIGDLFVGAGNDFPTRLSVGADGTALLADSTQAVGVRWGIAGVPGMTPKATGDYLIPALRASGNSTVAASSGSQPPCPFPVHKTVTIDALAGQVAVAEASTLFRLLLFAADADGYPATLVATVDGLDGATTGVKVGVLASSVVLTPGLYWGFLRSNSPGGTFRYKAITPNFGEATTADSLISVATTQPFPYGNPGTYATPTDPITAWDTYAGSSALTPYMGLRRA